MVPFTGKIRLAKGSINQPRVNVAYQKALAFKTVFDIILREGQVVGSRIARGKWNRNVMP